MSTITAPGAGEALFAIVDDGLVGIRRFPEPSTEYGGLRWVGSGGGTVLGMVSWEGALAFIGDARECDVVPLDNNEWWLTGFDPGPKLYLLRAPTAGLIKIGWANDMEERLHRLQRLSAVPLELVGMSWGAGRPLETWMHRRFAPLRQHGEWFEDRPEIEQLADHCGWTKGLISWGNSVLASARERRVP